jgi:prolyl-tRNA synthetase
VVRWEMRTRLFLRTAEFLWQEGHTAHATREEALIEAEKMLNVYAEFAEKFMAMPVLKGVKSPNERFAGAIDTYCIEGLMQDGKALQAGTSHFLGQNFAKAFDVKFLNKENVLDYVWATSWGVSTRLIGALIMCHSDNYGLVLPPKLAPLQVVIIPIYKTEEQLQAIKEKVSTLMASLVEKNISVKFDDDDSKRSGWKFNEYELKGVPIRMAIGPRDLENNQVEIARRDTLEKHTASFNGLTDHLEKLLEEIQQNIYNKALKFREENTHNANTWDEFIDILDNKGGFVRAHWDGTSETEEAIKEKTKATIRVIPFDNENEEGKCILTGKPSSQRVIFARAY